MQSTLLGLAIALIVALLAALLGPYFIDWNSHRAFFEAEASRLVGLKVSVTGNIDATLLPTPAVTLGEIAVGSTQGASHMAAQSLRIELALGSLMRGEIRATELRLVAPRADIGFDFEGQIDWPRLAFDAENVSVGRLYIENGRVTLIDTASKSQIVLDQLHFLGELRSLAGPIRGRGEFVSGGGLFGYELSAGRSGPDGVRVRLGLKTDEHRLSAELDGSLALDRGTPRVTGTLAVVRPASSTTTGVKPSPSESWRLNSKVTGDGLRGVLEDVVFELGPEERAVVLAGAGDYRLGQDPLLQLSMSARQADVDRLLGAPGVPRRPPLAAIQTLIDGPGGIGLPAWPMKLSFNVGTMTLGGGTIQSFGLDLRKASDSWTVDRFEFRAPGMTHVKADGWISATGKSAGNKSSTFIGGGAIESRDPRNLFAWLGGTPAEPTLTKSWQIAGDITVGTGRISIERLQAKIQSGAIDGHMTYQWPAGREPARLEASLRANVIDFDEITLPTSAALTGLGLEWPGALMLSVEAGRTRYRGVDARDLAIGVSLAAGEIAIERFTIGEIDRVANLSARGRMSTRGPASGSIAAQLDVHDLAAAATIVERFSGVLAQPLHRLAAQQKSAVLRARFGSSNAKGALEVTGEAGAVRLAASVNLAEKSMAFWPFDREALAAAEFKADMQVASADPVALLSLLGLDRTIAVRGRPVRLALAAEATPGRDIRIESRLDAGAIDLAGSGYVTRSRDRPLTISFERITGRVGANVVQGRLALRAGEVPRLEGSVESDGLESAAVLGSILGMPAGVSPVGGSVEPFIWQLPGLGGEIEIKAQRVSVLPGLDATKMRAIARFQEGELKLEEISGQIGNGAVDGRVVIEDRGDGISAKVKLALTGADPRVFVSDVGGSMLSGRLAMTAELEGFGRSPAALMGSLKGSGALTLERAKIPGLNPGVFGALIRATELGIPMGGPRIREFTTGILDSAPLAFERASATMTVAAGQAKFSDIAIKKPGTALQASASIALEDGALDMRIVLQGTPSAPGALPPAIPIVFKGELTSPQRIVDTGPITSWLTLRAIEQQSRQIDVLERAVREITPSAGALSPAVPRGAEGAQDPGKDETGSVVRPTLPALDVQAQPTPP